MTGKEAKPFSSKRLQTENPPSSLPPRIFRPSYEPVTESMYVLNIFMLAEIKVNFTADKC